MLMLLIGLALVLAWVFRMTLAERYLARYCDAREVTCEAEISSLSLNRAEIDNVRVSTANGEPLVADRLEVDLTWPALFVPSVTQVSVTKPVLRAAFDGQTLSLNGLERLIPESSGGGGPAPDLTIDGGRVFVMTPAGELAGGVDLKGQLPKQGEAHITIDPASISSGEDILAWSKGDVHLQITGGQIRGSADLKLEQAILGDLSLSNAAFIAELKGEDAAPEIVWDGSMARAAFGQDTLTSATTNGAAVFSSLPDGGVDAAIAALTEIVAEVQAEAITMDTFQSGPISIGMDLSKTDNAVRGPVAVTVDQLETSLGTAKLATATGDLRLDASRPGDAGFAGALVLKGASVKPARRSEILGGVRLPAPYVDHGRALRGQLNEALSDFDTGADIIFDRRLGISRLTASRPTAVRAGSGLTISIEPLTSPEWLLVDSDGLKVNGKLIAAGGGVPTVRAVLNLASWKPGAFLVDTSQMVLEPWTQAGRTLALNMEDFQLSSTAGALRVAGDGELQISGALPGIDLQTTRLSGGVDAAKSKAGWRVQTRGDECLALSTQGIRSGVLKLDALSVPICPEDGKFISEEGGKPHGRILLGDVTLPFSTPDTNGDITLTDSALNWVLDDGLGLTIDGARAKLPMTIGTRTLSIDSDAPSFTLKTGQGPLKIDASLGESVFGGSIIPANMSASSFTFDGQSDASGVNGTILAPSVRISDYRANPIYTPMRANLRANLRDGRLILSGPLSLASTGQQIANANADIGIIKLIGTASVTSNRLQFTPNGFQPSELSERLRGVLVNARGAIEARSDLTITGGKLAGTADIKLDAFGFDTFRVGSIDGVNGDVRFSDIMTLTTAPDQIVTVEAIDPGVLLKNGRIAFQLIDGNRAEIQGAVWPFAGGSLSIKPTSWQIGNKTQNILFTAAKLEMDQLVAALSLKDINARGTVSGDFPIEIIGPKAFIRNAVLKADNSGGKLAYTGAALEPVKGRNLYSDYAVEALKDFNFTVLELGADGNITGDIMLTLKLSGRNPQVLDGQVFDFNVGVDSKLAQLIRNTQNALSQDIVLKEVARGVREGRDSENEQPATEPFN